MNIEFITIPLEFQTNIYSIIKKVHKMGYKVGISIKPNTKVEEILPYIEYLDLVLLMTVEPGLGGQPFLEESINRLKELKKIIPNNIKASRNYICDSMGNKFFYISVNGARNRFKERIIGQQYAI